jgi:hypothetical protein
MTARLPKLIKGMKSASRIPDVIKAELARSQHHTRALGTALDMEYTQYDKELRKLVQAGEVIVLGTARQAGYTGVRHDAPIYGLPGAKLKYVGVKAKDRENGNIAGPIVIRGYRFGWKGGPW